VVLSAIGIKMPDLLLASIKPLGLAATAHQDRGNGDRTVQTK
jgi:hypothetical protein